jgi:hypothetical protein
MGQGHDWHQVTYMKAGGARIKANVAGNGPRYGSADAVCIGHLFDEASLGQHVEYIVGHESLLHDFAVVLAHYTP